MNFLKKLLESKVGRAAYQLLLMGLLLSSGIKETGTNVLRMGTAVETSYAFQAAAVIGRDEEAAYEKEKEQYLAQVEKAQAEKAQAVAEEEDTDKAYNGAPYDFTVAFAGDINLDENWSTTKRLNGAANGIYDCISPELIEEMQNADIMCLNNEFTYSNRGAPMSGKAYTFRALPERVEVLKTLGVDVVKLANNHVYDYGEEAFLDTIAVLDSAGIAHMGAGRNMQEAMTPVYMQVGGKTVAFVAASRAEKNIMTPEATENTPGILRCYDTARFKEVIKQARANADFVIAYVHWGTEYSFQLEKAQRSTGKEYLDAGADAVIGAHSHCLQGMEYYKGKPILYSLGNYWFNSKTLDTALAKLHFYGDSETGAHLDIQMIPAVQSGCETHIATEEAEKRRILTFLESISVNAGFRDNGTMYQRE